MSAVVLSATQTTSDAFLAALIEELLRFGDETHGGAVRVSRCGRSSSCCHFETAKFVFVCSVPLYPLLKLAAHLYICRHEAGLLIENGCCASVVRADLMFL